MSAQSIQWERRYGTAGGDGAIAVLQTNDGGYITAGYTAGRGTAPASIISDGYLVKFNRNGEPEWARDLDTSVWLISVIPWKDGGYVVAGTRDDNAYVAAVDAEGELLRRTTIPERGVNVRKAITTSDGGFLVAGYYDPIDGADSYGLVFYKFDRDGVLAWKHVLGGTAILTLNDVMQGSDGGFIFAGAESRPGRAGSDMYVAGIDADGDPVFMHSNSTTLHNGAFALLAADDGGYLLGGYALDTATTAAMVVMKVDTAGMVQWEHIYAGASPFGRYKLAAMVRMGDGGRAVLAMVGERYPYLLRLDADGRRLWDTTYRRNDPERRLFGIARSSDGGLVLAGTTKSEALPGDVLIMKVGAGVSGVNDPDAPPECMGLS